MLESLSVRPTNGQPRALEVGCGDGVQSSVLAEDCELVSIDIVRQNLVPPGLILASFESLPFRRSVFRLVFSSNVLEHVRNREAALREAARVLAEGGTVVTIVPTDYWKAIEMLTSPARWLIEVIAYLWSCRPPKRGFGPSILVHGEYVSNSEEMRAYRVREWVALHLRADLRDVQPIGLTVGYLPFEFPVPFESVVTSLSSVGVAIIARSR